jgi:predicted DCC family thiol-disulfide oxidoreductase YuxK
MNEAESAKSSKDQSSPQQPGDYVLYDGACPVCARYVAATGLAACRGGVVLIDARTHPSLVAEHAAAGRSIDDGMVVAIGGEMHYGADATRKLAEIGQPATLARRSLLWFVGTAPWADALYPVLSAGRRVLLRLLGRPLIDVR